MGGCAETLGAGQISRIWNRDSRQAGVAGKSLQSNYFLPKRPPHQYAISFALRSVLVLVPPPPFSCPAPWCEPTHVCDMFSTVGRAASIGFSETFVEPEPVMLRRHTILPGGLEKRSM